MFLLYYSYYWILLKISLLKSNNLSNLSACFVGLFLYLEFPENVSPELLILLAAVRESPSFLLCIKIISYVESPWTCLSSIFIIYCSSPDATIHGPAAPPLCERTGPWRTIRMVSYTQHYCFPGIGFHSQLPRMVRVLMSSGDPALPSRVLLIVYICLLRLAGILDSVLWICYIKICRRTICCLFSSTEGGNNVALKLAEVILLDTDWLG